MNFDPYFKAYEDLVAQVEAAFNRVKSEHETAVKCKVGCSDCCYAIFDLSLIEAIYINTKFKQAYDDQKRNELLEKANKADREIMKLKRDAHKQLKDGKNESLILHEMAEKRVRCPMLNDDDRCDLYESRPITCRLYGIPLEIGGQSRSCRLSAFESGKAYPTIKMDQIHKQLYNISFALSQGIQSKYSQLAEMLVPLSMALLTDYTEDYLGVKNKKDVSTENEGEE